MGQKTHPLAFRLNTLTHHKSIWYSNWKQYAEYLQKDSEIRNYIKTVSKKYGIVDFEIKRNTLKNMVKLELVSIKPTSITGKNIDDFERIRKKFENDLPKENKVILGVSKLDEKNQSWNAQMLANLMAEHLEKRIAFRQVIRETIKSASLHITPGTGIKIQISGRLNGIEIARKEWTQEGRVPLQTLRASIDYATSEAHTIYGVLGIKVWLCKGDIFIK